LDILVNAERCRTTSGSQKFLWGYVPIFRRPTFWGPTPSYPLMGGLLDGARYWLRQRLEGVAATQRGPLMRFADCRAVRVAQALNAPRAALPESQTHQIATNGMLLNTGHHLHARKRSGYTENPIASAPIAR